MEVKCIADDQERQTDPALTLVPGRVQALFIWGFSANKPPVQPGVGKKYFSKRKRKPPVLRLMYQRQF